MTQVKSVRITKAARQDMLDAVMGEWEKQNPCPEGTAWDGVLDLVAEQIKKSNEYERTQRFSAALVDLEEGDLRYLETRSEFYAQVMDSADRIRTTIGVCFTLSQAESRGLKGFVTSRYKSNSYVDGVIAESDWKDDEYIWAFGIVADNRPTVIINGDDPKYEAVYKEKRAIEKWEKTRDQLGSETKDLLENFNTTKQLREGWPEMVPYLPPHLADPDKVINLPVPQVSRLNERLGIANDV